MRHILPNRHFLTTKKLRFTKDKILKCKGTEEDFAEKDADEVYENWKREQQKMLDVILSEYQLNDLEKKAIEDYRRICRISMYPNVMSFI